jgi:hypothetical protein
VSLPLLRQQAVGHDAYTRHARAARRIDHCDDLAVAQRAVSTHEQSLVPPIREHVAKARLQSCERHRLGVDRDLAIRRVDEQDVRRIRSGRLLLLDKGKIHVEAFLREGQRRHEDDQHDEQDVDERRDVHLRVAATCVRAGWMFGGWHQHLSMRLDPGCGVQFLGRRLEAMG